MTQVPDGEPFVPLDAMTRINLENGRWVVYLNVPGWTPQHEDPITNNWKRINDYSREADAKVAARWIERSANKTFQRPRGF